MSWCKPTGRRNVRRPRNDGRTDLRLGDKRNWMAWAAMVLMMMLQLMFTDVITFFSNVNLHSDVYLYTYGIRETHEVWHKSEVIAFPVSFFVLLPVFPESSRNYLSHIEPSVCLSRHSDFFFCELLPKVFLLLCFYLFIFVSLFCLSFFLHSMRLMFPCDSFVNYLHSAKSDLH
jgi:hypothetical protein